MKKILFIGPIPPEIGGITAGGIATHNWGLALECAKNDYEVYVYSGQIDNDKKNNNIILLGRISKYNKIKNLEFSFSIKTLKRKLILKSLIKKIKPDIIHFHSLHNNLIDVIDKKMKKNRKIIVTDHGFWQMDVINKKIINKRMSLTDYVICVSKYCQEMLRVLTYSDSNKIITIYNPIHDNYFKILDKTIVRKKLGFKIEDKIVLYTGLGGWEKRKRLKLVVESIKQSNNIKYLFLVNSIAEEYIRNIVSKNLLDNSIIIFPPQHLNKLNSFYSAADVYVMPSMSESFGLVYIESLLAGTPIIGFDKTFYEFEKCIGYKIGEPFSVLNNSKDLQKKINIVLGMNFDRERVSKKVKQLFSFENQFINYDKIYKV